MLCVLPMSPGVGSGLGTATAHTVDTKKCRGKQTTQAASSAKGGRAGKNTQRDQVGQPEPTAMTSTLWSPGALGDTSWQCVRLTVAPMAIPITSAFEFLSQNEGTYDLQPL